MRKIVMVSALLLSLIRGVWAIEPDSATGYLPMVVALMKGQRFDFAQLAPKATANFSNLNSIKSDVNLVAPDPRFGFKGVTTKNSVAIIPLIGAVMKYDNCGDVGTKTLSQYFMQVENNPAFIGSVFLIDSPGGAVSGTGLLADFIYSLKKPVVTYVEGMMCSAALWTGTAADEVVVSHKTDVIGSIGTYLTLPDFSKQLEMEGIKLHEIYATASTEKNSLFAEAIKGNYGPIQAQLIDPINESFMAGVKRNRYGKGINNKVFKGGTYMSAEAINNGLADSQGDLDFAISRVLKLAA